METTKLPKKLIFWTGTIGFLLMVLGSLFYWKERMAFTDAAYHLFHILARNEYAIQSSRFVAYFTQSFILWPSRWGAPLSVVAQLYSASFPVLYLLCFWTLTLVFRNYRLGLAYLLLSFLMTTASFFWCLSDIIQGYAFLFIYLAFVLRYVEQGKRLNLLHRLLMLACLVFSVFSHPLMLFSAGFIYLFFIVRYPAFRRMLLFESAVFLVLFAIKTFVFISPNDANASSAFKSGLKLFPYLDLRANRDFLGFLVRDYYWVGILFFGALWFYLKNGKKWHAAFLACAFIGYVLLNNITAPGGTDQFYVENHYMGICVFVVFPFVWDMLPGMRITRVRSLFLPFAIATSLLGIYRHHFIFTERVDWIEGLIGRMKSERSDKWIIRKENAPQDKLFMFWGASFEVWLLSTVEEGQTYSAIIQERDGEFDDGLYCNTCLRTTWETFPYEKLNPRYFIFRHTSFPYSFHQ